MKTRDSMWALLVAAIALGLGCSTPDTDEPHEGGASLRITSFIAEDSILDFGDSTFLSWRTAGAATTIVRSGDEILAEKSSEPNGLLEVSPSRTQTYELVIRSGAGEEKSASVEVAVRPSILEFETDARGQVAVGQPVVVRWKTGGAVELHLLAAGGHEQAIPQDDIQEGSAEIPVPADGKVRLRARSGSLEANAELSLDAIEIDLPSIASFVATPAQLTAGSGESTELSWTTAGATSLVLLANGSPVELGDNSPSEGTIGVEVDETTVFVLEATNLAGTTTKELTVEALPLPRIETFRATPSRVAAGEGFELSWATTDAAIVELLQDDTLLELGSLETSGSVERQLAADAHFVLRAYNEVGSFVDRVLEVTVGEPIVTSFMASPKVVTPGAALTLSWTCDGGTSLIVKDADGAVLPSCGTADPALVAEGSCTLMAPERFGHLPYTLEVQNELAASTAVATTSLHVVSGPLDEIPTVEFESSWVEHDPLAAEGVTIHWTTTKATRLDIYQLDEAGLAIEPPVLATDDPERVAAGSVVVDPDTTSTFRAVAKNVYDDEQVADIEVRLLLVEIDSFDAAPLEVLAGDLTTLAWTTTRALSVELDYDVSFSFTQGHLPFVELRDRESASELAIAGTCGQRDGSANILACPTLEFTNFTFPMGDQSFDRAKVSVSGGITFDMSGGQAITTVVEPLPPTALPWDNMLAVLWNYLVADPARGSKLLYEFGSEGGRDNLIVEWSQVYPRGGRGDCTKALSFQVVLWNDGSFDYRYGPFGDYLGDTNCVNLDTSVGYYSRASSQSAQVLLGAEPAGGLSGTSYSFIPTEIGVNDSVDVPLSGSRSFTLTAYGAKGSSVSRTVELIAHDLPTFVGQVGLVNPTIGYAPMSGITATLSWQTENAHAVEVFGPGGELLCAREDTSPTNGSCNIVSETPGAVEFTLRAHGALGSSVDRLHTVTFAPRLEVETLEATPDSFVYGTETMTTLSWATKGALGFTLLEDGVPVDPPVPMESWASGQRTFSLDRSRTYEIRLSGSDGREASATKTVDVITVQPFQASATPAQTVGNQPVTLSWNVPLLGSGDAFVSVEPTMPPMQEIPGNFIGIETTGAPVPGFATANNTLGTAMVTLPFPFPYFGDTHTEVKIGQSGVLSFSSTTPMNGGPMDGLLNWYNTGVEKPHIAPYYADMRTYSVGNAYTIHQPGGRGVRDAFIIQWDRMQLHRNAIPTPGEERDDLTFQLVLFDDGSFEFRYASMVSPDRQAEAGGVNATAGYRKPGLARVEKGDMLFYSPPNPLVLTNRTWRYQALKAIDSLTLSPTVSTVYTICVQHRDYEACSEVPVAVPAAGDLIVTELQLRPDGGASNQWFELRNLSHVPIDLAGMEIHSAAGITPIASETPLVVQPGGYFTLAASADPGFVPDHVYGSTILGDGIDGIELLHGDRVVATLDWDESWILPQGKTLSLDPIHHKRSSDAPTRFESFCVGTEVGSPNAGFGCASPYYVVDPYSSRQLIDISTTGTRIQQMEGAKYTLYLPGGFEMPFFGDRVEKVWLSSNGFLGFQGTPWIGSVSDPIPTYRGTGLVAGLWTGLQSVGPYWPDASWFRYQTVERSGQKVLVLHWEHQRRYTTSGAPENVGDVSLQIQLWENGDIVMLYPSMWGDPMHFGAGATVGIEALDGTTGIQYLYEEAALREGQAILFEYQQP